MVWGADFYVDDRRQHRESSIRQGTPVGINPQPRQHELSLQGSSSQQGQRRYRQDAMRAVAFMALG